MTKNARRNALYQAAKAAGVSWKRLTRACAPRRRTVRTPAPVSQCITCVVRTPQTAVADAIRAIQNETRRQLGFPPL